MAITAEQSIAQSQAEGDEQYRGLLGYVLGAGDRRASAYEAELRVFRGVLALGRTLLRLFFEQRAAERPAGPVTAADGTAPAAVPYWWTSPVVIASPKWATNWTLSWRRISAPTRNTSPWAGHRS